MNPPRPRPKLDNDNRAFWTGGGEGKLNIMKCADCSTYLHPPKPICHNCLSENIAPEAVAGTGAVETFTVNYQPWAKDLEVPYVIARVRLDGVPGVYLTTNIINCAPEDVHFDDRVKVSFSEENGIWYPLFEKEG